MELAYLPQHSWEVGMSVIGANLIVLGLVLLLLANRFDRPGTRPVDVRRRQLVEWPPRSQRTARLLGALQIAVAAGVIAVGFLTSSEPPCGRCGGDGWGGTTGKVTTGVGSLVVTAIMAIHLHEVLRAARRGGHL